MDAALLKTLPHLSDITPETLIKDIGINEPILVDVYSETVATSGIMKVLSLSPDVAALTSLIKKPETVNLPCPDCNKETEFTKSLPKADDSKKKAMSETTRIMEMRQSYGRGNLPINSYHALDDYIWPAFNKVDKNLATQASSDCFDGLIRELPSFVVKFDCTSRYKHQIHSIFSLQKFECDGDINSLVSGFAGRRSEIGFYNTCGTMFGLSDEDKNRTRKEFQEKYHTTANTYPEPIPTPEEQRAIDIMSSARFILVLRKIGQTPSVGKMKAVNLAKFDSIIGDGKTDLANALSLYYDGYSLGGYAYLKRAFDKVANAANSGLKAKVNSLSLPDAFDKNPNSITEDGCNEAFKKLEKVLEEYLESKV